MKRRPGAAALAAGAARPGGRAGKGSGRYQKKLYRAVSMKLRGSP